jgi:hypothetical protein
MDFEWDLWQKRVLAHVGNIVIRAGRQSGKSEVISEKAMRFALDNPGTVTMIIAASQRQSGLLFEKVRARCDENPLISYLEKPTLTRIIMQNGSRIYCLPAGRTAYSIRGYTIDLLIADEAAYIPETVWLAVTPMMAVSKVTKGFGFQILISTPFGKGGYFYESCHDKDFLSIHVSSEDCKRISKSFLAKEKKRLTKAQYAQEYLAEFVDEWHQFFTTELIKKCMSFVEWSKKTDTQSGRFYLGVDVARYGGDENAFVVSELVGKKLRIVKCFVTDRVSTVDTIGRIIEIDREFNFKKIFIDDSGVGGGVTDLLVERLGRRVMGINNASRRYEMQGEEKKKGILKEDLYSNVLMLMETGQLEMISDLGLLRSLKSITFEYTDTGRVKIDGSYAHLAEALTRACWCVKEKGLNLFIY